MPIIINLVGAPGAGKSTGAAYIFYRLKALGINAELITEFAKDKTWEHNSTALSNQLYILGKQYYRMTRCADQVDVIITDSPIILSLIYGQASPYYEELSALVHKLWGLDNNLLYYIKRVKEYNPAGRNQTAEESDAIGEDLYNLLKEQGFELSIHQGDTSGYQTIVDDILKKLETQKTDLCLSSLQQKLYDACGTHLCKGDCKGTCGGDCKGTCGGNCGGDCTCHAND